MNALPDACLEGAHQAGAQNIAGSLTRHQRNTQIGHDQRVMPRARTGSTHGTARLPGTAHRFGQFGQRLLHGQPLAIHRLVGAAQRMDRVVAETTTAHAFEVHAARFGGVAEHGDERRNVLADGRAHAGKAVRANVAILVNQV
jgi:hypothetical protein